MSRFEGTNYRCVCGGPPITWGPDLSPPRKPKVDGPLIRYPKGSSKIDLQAGPCEETSHSIVSGFKVEDGTRLSFSRSVKSAQCAHCTPMIKDNDYLPSHKEGLSLV